MKIKCIECIKKLQMKLAGSGSKSSYSVTYLKNLYNDAWETLEDVGLSKKMFEESRYYGEDGALDGKNERTILHIKLNATREYVSLIMDEYYDEDEQIVSDLSDLR